VVLAAAALVVDVPHAVTATAAVTVAVRAMHGKTLEQRSFSIHNVRHWAQQRVDTEGNGH
jgi:hypothetical protein